MPIVPKLLGGAFQVNTATTDDQIFAKIAALPDGYVVVWMTDAAGLNGSSVHAQKYAHDGTPIGAEILVADTGQPSYEFLEYAAVNAMSDGGFVVTYTKFDVNNESTGIYGQRFDSDGNLVTPGQGSNPDPEFSLSAFGSLPSSTILDNGNYVITWTGTDGSESAVLAQVFDPNGQEIGVQISMTSGAGFLNAASEITALQNGGFVVSWTINDPDVSSGRDIMAQVFDQNGIALGPEFLVNTFTDDSQHDCEITALADGTFVITWVSIELSDPPAPPSITGVHLALQRFDATGMPIGSEFRFGDHFSPQGGGFRPNITATPDGGYIVVWTDGYYDSVTSSNLSFISGQRFDANGEEIGDIFTVAELGNISSNNHFIPEPDIELLSDGSYVVTWDAGTGVGTDNEIFAQHFAAQYYGTSGDDTLSDTVGANWMRGITGDDTLYGLDGNDKIFGNRGDDTLYGGAGNDKLIGGGGADTLIGGAGKDILKGGAGADVFVFNDVSDSHAGGVDRVKDFQTGIDTIDLAGIVAGELTFLGDTDFTSTGVAELRYFQNAKGNTFLLADIDGDGGIDFKVFFKGTIDFTVDDFIL